MLLSEQFKVIGLGTSTDFNNGFTAESINTKDLHSIMFVLTYGAVGGAGAAVLTVKSGATDGVQTTAETFYSRYGGGAQGAASSDVYSDWASGTSVAVATATITTRTQIIEIDCSALTAGQPWVTLALSNAADSGIVHGVAICVPRFPGNAIPTAI
jgi:hypothetical protein